MMTPRSLLAGLFFLAGTWTILAAPPGNDNQASATTLSGDTATDTVSNVEATQEAGDVAYRTVWWKWTAPANGKLTIDTVGSTSTYLSLLVNLSTGGNVTSISGGGSTTRTSFPVAVGTTYVMSLGTYYSSGSYAGTAKLSLSLDRTDPVGTLPIAAAASLAQDNFASRVTLSGASASALAYNASASTEAGEPTALGSKTMWWTYRPAATGRVTITNQGSTVQDCVLAAYLGTNVSALRTVAINSSSTAAMSISFPVAANTDYQIAMGASYGSSGTMVISLSLDSSADVSTLNVPNPATMANDNFINRITLSGANVSAIAHNKQATNEAGEPSASGARTMWWTYRPAQTGRLSITTQGSEYAQQMVAVYLGSSVASLRQVTSDGSYSGAVNMTFPVTANTDYQISVGNDPGAGSNGGSIVLSLSLDTAADVSLLDVPLQETMVNDSFVGRTVLPKDTMAVIAHNASATTEAGEPAGAGYRTLWWTYRPTVNGQLSISTQGTSAFYETISIYLGSGLGGLRQITTSGYASGSTIASLSIPVTAGTDYQVSIGGYNSGDYGDIVLSFNLDTSASVASLNIPNPVTVANDNFVNRLPLVGGTVAAICYPQICTVEAGEPAASSAKTSWFTYRPTENGMLHLNTTGNAVYLAVYQGATLAGLRLIVGVTNRYTSDTDVSLSAPVTANTDYQISVGLLNDSWTNSSSVLSLALDTTADVAKLNIPSATTYSNDNFASRATLTGNPVSVIAYNGSATAEVGEPATSGSNTFWWTYRPTMTGNLRITSAGTTFGNQTIGVYQGVILSGLRLVSYKDQGYSSTPIDLTIPVTKDTDYQISFGTSNSSNTGTIVMTVAVEPNDQLTPLRIPNPASTINDSFSNLVALSGNAVSAIGYNPGATREPLEPTGTYERTLWWSWTSSRNGKATVDLTGTTFLSYARATVWKGTALQNLTQVTVTSGSFDVVSGQTYFIAVGTSSTNTGSSYNGTIVLTVNGPPAVPQFTTAPLNQLVSTGSDFTLTAVADGANVTYQWLKNGTAITGATGSSYTVTGATLASAGAYAVKATNLVGSSTSSAANVVVYSPDASSKTVNEGSALTVAGSVAGPGATYRWRKNGTDLADSSVATHKITGSTKTTLSITPSTPSDDGSYTCRVTLPDTASPGSFLTASTGAVTVTMNLKPVVAADPVPAALIGAPVSWQLHASESPSAFIISGLPGGLSAITTTGLISGRPTVSGSFAVKASARNAVGTGPVRTFTLVIGSVDENATGSFTALVERDASVNQQLGGLLTLNVLANTTFTGSLKNGVDTHQLNGRLVTAVGVNPVIQYTVVRSGRTSLVLSLAFDPALKTITGTVQNGTGTAGVTGQRHPWTSTGAALYAGPYNSLVELPAGSENDTTQPLGAGWQQMTVTAAGVASGSGRTADGQSYTYSARLWPNYALPQFTVLYGSQGSVTGLPQILSDYSVTGWVDQIKLGPVGSTDRTYKTGIPYLRRVVNGGSWFAPNAAAPIVLGLPDAAGNASIAFTKAGIESAAQYSDLDQVFRISRTNVASYASVTGGNPCGVSMKITASTGLFTGSFLLTDTVSGKPVTRTVNYAGIFLSHLNKGLGYFTLPDLNPSVATSPILSGRVTVN